MEFLHPVAQAYAQYSSGSQCIEGLYNVISCSLCVFPGVQEGRPAYHPVGRHPDPYGDQPTGCDHEQSHLINPGSAHKQHGEYYHAYYNEGAEVWLFVNQGKKDYEYNQAGENCSLEVSNIILLSIQEVSYVDDYPKLGEFHWLEAEPPNP